MAKGIKRRTYKKGSAALAARNDRVQKNLGLVHMIALGFRTHGLDMDDLVGEGHLGLIRAAEEFDPRFGTAFSTYAAFWIKERIRAAIRGTTATIRVPSYLFQILMKWRRVSEAMTARDGYPPTFEQVVAVLKLKPRQRIVLAKALEAYQLKPGCDLARERPCSKWPAEDVEDYRTIDRLVVLDRADQTAAIAASLGRLDSRERTIVEKRFGLGHCEPATLETIGQEICMTRDQVQYVLKCSLRKIAAMNLVSQTTD